MNIVLFGGSCSETFVSTASAQAISKYIDAKLWFWDKNLAIYEVSNRELNNFADPFTHEFVPITKPIYSDIEEAIKNNNDQVFVLALHGGKGENGYLQKIFEKYNAAFTGSNSLSSHNAFNKIITKELLRSTDILLAPHQKLNSVKEIEDFYDEYQDCILKPISDGSSLGCFKITCKNDIALVAKKLTHQDYMIEKLIYGKELTVGVAQNTKEAIALCPTEIILDTNRDFDYEAKYLMKGSKEITPANICIKLAEQAKELALNVHNKLNLYGYSRSDMISNKDGIYFLEVNTLPGLTAASLLPQQLAFLGISMTEFLNNQIYLALLRKNKNIK